MELINIMVNKIGSWVDNLFSLFSYYTERYSGIMVWGFMLLAAAKIFKIKLDKKS